MAGDVDKVEEAEEAGKKLEDAANINEVDDQEPRDEDSSSLKRKIKKDCNSRRRLEERLEETRVQRQVQDYDFDDLD